MSPTSKSSYRRSGGPSITFEQHRGNLWPGRAYDPAGFTVPAGQTAGDRLRNDSSSRLACRKYRQSSTWVGCDTRLTRSPGRPPR